EYMERLIERGFAYSAEGSVYFDVAAWSRDPDGDYGHLSGNRPEDVDQGESADLRGKRDPRDFALWKAAQPGEPSWPTPWGDGRPGWHLECSAMATWYLGGTFDIQAAAWTCGSRTTRTRWRRPTPPATGSPAIGCTT